MGLVLLLGLSGAAAGQPTSVLKESTTGPSPTTADAGKVVPQASYTTVNTTLSVGGLVGNLSPDFWGVTVNNEVHLLRDEANKINGTPVRVLVWPGAMAGEDYDPLKNIHYDTYTGSPKTALTSEQQFVDMCKAIHCTAVMQLPAEINDAAYAEKIVNYTEVNLSFTPAYWMIGNEPELWSHWNVPWKHWGYDYTYGPTPTQFGQQLLTYVAKIRQVDNTTPILGLPASGCTCGSWTFSQWISGVLNVTGDKIQVVAFHEYPAGWLGTGSGSLFDFYGTLQGAAGIPVRMLAARQAVQTSCPGCNVSVWISELGSALSWSTYGQYAAGFSGALSIAAQMTQSMDVNLTNVDLFAAELATTNSWFNQTAYARPDYALYTQILNHLGTALYPVNFTGLGKTIYGIATNAPQDGGRRDLMVINANLSHSIAFVPQFAGYSGAAPAEAWYWNGSIHVTSHNHTTWVEPYTTNPLPQEFPSGLPATYVIPPQSLVVFETYPSGSSFVRVVPTGVPAPTAWYTGIGSRFYTTTGDNISLLLPSGSYAVQPRSISLPIGGKELTPIERLAGFATSPVRVTGSHTTISIAFVDQWTMNISASPAEGGTVGPIVDWANASQPLTLSVTPAFGYAFTRWGGWGPGSYNGTARTITISPTGRVHETAHFAVGVPGLFWEDGLPYNSPWSVTVRGFTTDSSSNGLVVYEPAGIYGYHVEPVPGFRIIPQNGSFIPLGVTTHIHFIALTPAPPAYSVTFLTTGLPGSTSVTITVRGVTQSADPTSPAFGLIDGTYAYQVGYVAGYHASVPLKLFDVAGGPLTVVVPFVRTVYTSTWQAVGVRSGMIWGVELNGTPITATSAWLTASLPNGTYSYAIDLPANYSASPRTGFVTIEGFGATVFLNFDLMRFATGFEAVGPGSTNPWSVRLGNLTLGASANRSGFTAANGTYTFSVHPPAGYYAVPSHGNLTVAGPTVATQIHFYPTSLRPSAELVAQLTSGALVVSAWIGLSAVLGFLVIRAARRRGG